MAVRLCVAEPNRGGSSINSPIHVLLSGTKVDVPGINENMISSERRATVTHVAQEI